MAAVAFVAGSMGVLAAPASASPSLTAPSSGVAGRTIVVSGGGWPSLETVYAYLDQGTAHNYFCGLTTDANGNLGAAACSLPTSLPQGPYTLRVTDSTNTATEAFTLMPGAHAGQSASGGAIAAAADGQTVFLAGVGFTAGSTISSVSIGASSVSPTPASPTVSSQGNFNGVSVTVPAAQPVGNTTVTITDSASQVATFSLTIYAATDTAASAGVSGRNLTIAGTGWPINDSIVYVYLQQGATLNYFCGVSVDASGDLGPTACSLPTNLPQGSYVLYASDGSVAVSKPFTLNPGAYVSGTSSSGRIGSVARGQMVYLTGSGFTAGSTISSVKIGATTLTATPAAPAVSTQGGFNGVTFSIPKTGTAGTATVTVTDSSAQAATFNLAVFNATDTSPTSGVAGRNLAVSGAGWPANDTVYMYLNQGTTSNYFCSVYVDDSGNLGPQHCTLPTNLPQGAYVLSATDGSVTVNKNFTLNAGARLQVASNGATTGSAAGGQTVYLSGNGFTSNGTIKKVTVGGVTVALNPAVPVLTPQGYFSNVALTIPASLAAGATSVVVTDSSNKAATFALNVYNVTVSAPASGTAGQSVALSGGGWPAGDTVYAYLNQGSSQNYFCYLTTDSSGNLGPATCALPTNLPQGAYTLYLSDGYVGQGRSFTLSPAVTLTNTSNQQIVTAARGSTVDFSGAGFSASSTITSVTIGSTTVTVSPSTPLVNAQGNFSGASFTVPSSLAVGSYTVTVTDSSGKSGTAPLSVS